MGEILAGWISVGDSMFERTELYSNQLDKSFDRFIPAPFGGPILIVHENMMRIHAASGVEIAKWRWRTAGHIVTIGWSLEEEIVYAIDDGTVLVHNIYGDLIQTTSMGQEAKDVKIRDAKVFRSTYSTGVAVLTTSNRFFVVNNLKEPRVRRFYDADLPHPGVAGPPSWPWGVLAFERHARILCATHHDLVMLSLSDSTSIQIDTIPEEKGVASLLAVSPDSSLVAILSTNGLLWLGRIEDMASRIVQVKMDTSEMELSEIVWCGNDAVLGFSPESSQCILVSALSSTPSIEKTFMSGYVAAVAEIDGARVFSLYSQDLVRRLPKTLVQIFAIGSVSPGARLRLATEEFIAGSHRADEYIRGLEDNLNQAVDDCVQAAGLVHEPSYQKTLMKAAQFGKAFCARSSSVSSEKFSQMCKNLRVLNGLREYRVGVPITLAQYDHLTSSVVIDRLLARRLFPLAAKVCQFLQIPAINGHSRVLAHWACYKVSQQDEDDASIAKAIEKRFSHQQVPHISYYDIASKAAECGKTQLAIRLLEHETSVSKQVPLLMRLGQEAAALSKALGSGDRDLAYSVILHLRKTFSSSDFHMLIRKYPLGRVLYESYCAAHDPESLQDWYVQEDDYSAQALHQVERAMAATRTETRQAILVNVQELFKKAKAEPLAALTEDHYRLLKAQGGLEEKCGKSFVGLTLHQTLSDLIQYDEHKFADKLRQEFKLTDRRYTWLKITTWARTHKWNELKKYSKQKKMPVPMTQVVKLVREHGGQEAAQQFLSEEYLNNEDRFNLLSEFGLYVEAASAAFAGKNMEALNSLEAMCAGREDVLKSIAGYKAKLIGAAATSSWRS